jgi:hypothetical protein
MDNMHVDTLVARNLAESRLGGERARSEERERIRNTALIAIVERLDRIAEKMPTYLELEAELDEGRPVEPPVVDEGANTEPKLEVGSIVGVRTALDDAIEGEVIDLGTTEGATYAVVEWEDGTVGRVWAEGLAVLKVDTAEPVTDFLADDFTPPATPEPDPFEALTRKSE